MDKKLSKEYCPTVKNSVLLKTYLSKQLCSNQVKAEIPMGEKKEAKTKLPKK
jgi:hypothetical protein